MTLAAAMLALALKAPAAAAEKNNDTYIRQEYVAYCEEIGEQYSICPELLEAMVETESSGNPKAYNAGCCGLMQVDATIHADRIKRLGVSDIYDPYGNILVGADILAEKFEEYGDDLGLCLLHYNGCRNAEDMALKNEFSEYADKVMARSYELEEAHGKHDY